MYTVLLSGENAARIPTPPYCVWIPPVPPPCTGTQNAVLVPDHHRRTVRRYSKHRPGHSGVLVRQRVRSCAERHDLKRAAHIDRAAVVADDHRVRQVRQLGRIPKLLGLSEVHRHDVPRVRAPDVQVRAIYAGVQSREIGFEVTGFPLPNRPIWLNGEGLQLGGWQTAVIAAAPGKAGVTVPAVTAGIVVGVVDSNSRLRPVMYVSFPAHR